MCADDAMSGMTPQNIEQRYGCPGRTETVSTSDGAIAERSSRSRCGRPRHAVVIPAPQAKEPHAVYVRDGDGLHPLHVQSQATRDEITRAPAVVATHTESPHPNKRSWERDAIIIGGGAGAGTAIGAIAGGKKGAGIGAAAGGVGGLLYDLITRSKK